ncbi:phosphatidylinositol N-acetylglucosaminyltransferase subunit Q [Chrysoperla carnea]|uniref:phosphatidylinositol N-acetylglucosaminyltransferase subunit Q n=1 Tax=Chrysoperla carnea TaxID=189513 RepID=UPI001D08BE67|nr:phosphatidylinositol N-acetylglucosaminyltransferase subunit Q [Chrysoperla carnea]
MLKIFLFIPSDIKIDCWLNGFIRKSSNEISFYVIHSTKRNRHTENERQIGYFGTKYNVGSSNSSQEFVHLSTNQNNELEIKQLKLQNINDALNHPECEIFYMKYDRIPFEKSELFQKSPENYDKFQILSESIKETKNRKSHNIVNRFVDKILFTIISLLHLFLEKILTFLNTFESTYKYSSLGNHAVRWLKQLYLIVDVFKKNGRFNLQTWNLVFAIPVDIMCGFILVYYISHLQDSVVTVINRIVEGAVSNLRELLEWLMGSPAGLKLNHSFNVLLGRFFLYHINLWWTFLMAGIPLVQGLKHVKWLAPFGLTFVTALLADLIALGTFHVYCIYVYASRFYRFQIMGLSALWRLFLGRKYNPLRNRVDSCQYSHRQLFVGTLAFTILLFLLPTTTMYYAVFATLRLCLIAIDEILLKLKIMLQNFPLFITYMWLIKAPMIAGNINIKMDSSVKKCQSFYVTLEPKTWSQTLEHCKLNQQENSQKISGILQKVLSGYLL